MDVKDFKAWRTAEGMTQKEAADHFGVWVSTIRDWEKYGMPERRAIRWAKERASAAATKQVGRPAKPCAVIYATTDGEPIWYEKDLPSKGGVVWCLFDSPDMAYVGNMRDQLPLWGLLEVLKDGCMGRAINFRTGLWATLPGDAPKEAFAAAYASWRAGELEIDAMELKIEDQS